MNWSLRKPAQWCVRSSTTSCGQPKIRFEIGAFAWALKEKSPRNKDKNLLRLITRQKTGSLATRCCTADPARQDPIPAGCLRFPERPSRRASLYERALLTICLDPWRRLLYSLNERTRGNRWTTDARPQTAVCRTASEPWCAGPARQRRRHHKATNLLGRWFCDVWCQMNGRRWARASERARTTPPQWSHTSARTGAQPGPVPVISWSLLADKQTVGR